MKDNTGSFKAVQRPNAVEDVLEAFQEALIQGRLHPKQRLPSEAKLGQQLGVGRGTIREAMKMLSAMGVVESRQGDGTYIQDTISPKVINPLLFAMLIEAENVHDLYEFRQMIDVAYTQLATEKATPDDFARMESIIDEMIQYRESGKRDTTELAELDLKFHHAVLDATKNPLVIKIGQMLTEMFRETVRKSVGAPGGVRWTIRQHRHLLDAIKSGDLEQVKQAVIYGLDVSRTRQEESDS